LITLFDRLFCVFSALLFTQVPRFIELYTTRLAGHVTEAERIVNRFVEVAKGFNLTLSSYIAKFLALSDPEIRSQGELMQESVDRLHALSTGYTHLIDASWYMKPMVFIRYGDWDIVRATMDNFSFGLSFTTQTLAWMVIGIAAAVAVMKIVSWLVRSLKSSFGFQSA